MIADQWQRSGPRPAEPPELLRFAMLMHCPRCATSFREAFAIRKAGSPSLHCPECNLALPAREDRPDHSEPQNKASSAFEEYAAPAQAPRRLLGPISGCIFALVCVSTVIGARNAIASAVPGTARIYAYAGLPVNVRGLEIRSITSRILENGDQRILAVEGDIANIRQNEMKMPALRLAVSGSAGDEIYVWESPATKPKIGPGETVHFRARLAAPPEGGQKVMVQFAADLAPPKKEPRTK